jgi:flavin-dependent dehydrogenase
MTGATKARHRERTIERWDAIVVGGGPAGSSCAWQLRRRGLSCLILDRCSFPRPKLCAGWITPDVVADLEMDVTAYPHRFMTFENTRVHLYGMSATLRAPQHSIRRYEFDDWLLQRSGAPMIVHDVKRIERQGNQYNIDDSFRCEFLIGAGGTGCPVYRSLFREHNPRARVLQVAALEHELPCRWQDGDCHLWFFDKGLPGYSWYVPKKDGYLNLGIGAIASRLKRKRQHLSPHWAHFIATLRKRRLIPDKLEPRPAGYAYYLRDQVDIQRLGNAFVIGDAAGLATRDMAEGIGPAVRSGILAANAIADGSDCRMDAVSAYSLPPGLKRRALEFLFVGRGTRPTGRTG